MVKDINRYDSRCGSCEHFMRRERNGKILSFGNCDITNKYKQASDKACKGNYKEENGK